MSNSNIVNAYSEHEIQFLKDNYKTMSFEKMGENLGRTRRAVMGKCHKMRLLQGLKGNRKYNTNEQYFDTWSYNMAYILGFIIGDGHLNLSKNTYRLSIQLNQKDDEINRFIRDEISPQKPIERFDYGDWKFTRLQINSKCMASRLQELGIVHHKTGNEVIPENFPEKYKFDFFRGVFDADGSIFGGRYWRKDRNAFSYMRRFALNIASKEFIKNLQSLLGFEFGYIRSKPGCYEWTVNKKEDLRFMYNKIYNENFCLKRKYDKFTQLIRGE